MVDMCGPDRGTISTSVTTLVGLVYRVSFWLESNANNYDPAHVDRDDMVTVSAHPSLTSADNFTHTSNTVWGDTWTQ